MQRVRKGRLLYVVDNVDVGGDPPPEILLWLALPVDRPGQRVRIETIDPEPADIVEDLLSGNRIALWRRTDVRSGEVVRFAVDFEIAVSTVHSAVDPHAIEPYDRTSEGYRRYTASEDYVAVTPEISAKAVEIADGEPNPWRAARRLFDWTVAEMSYEYPAMEDRGSARSFAKRKGDCGEFSAVFIALCRALGIPARMVVANWFHGGGHAWAEFFVPPYGWIPADTSMAQDLVPGTLLLGSETDNDAFLASIGITDRDPSWLFGNLYPHRIVVSVGNDLDVVSRRTGLARRFRFLQPGGHASWPESIEMHGVGEHAAHTEIYLFDEERDDEAALRREMQKKLATAYFAAGDHARAEPGLELVVAEKPDDAIAWLHLGQIRANRGDFERADEAYRASIAGRAGSMKPVIEAWARIFLGNALDARGRREEAAVQYRKAIESGIDYQGSGAAARGYLDRPFDPERSDAS